MTTELQISNEREDFLAANPEIAAIRKKMVPKLNKAGSDLEKILAGVRKGQIDGVNKMRDVGLLILQYEDETRVPGRALTIDLLKQESQMSLPLKLTYEQVRICRQVAKILTEKVTTIEGVREVERQLELLLGLKSGKIFIIDESNLPA